MSDSIDYKIFRVAEPGMVNDIITLYEAGGWWDCESKPEIIPEMVKGTFIFLGAQDINGRLVGMGRAISDGVSDAYIQDVVVLEEFRGYGIGGTIISTLTRLCMDKGLLWIGLVAEPDTESFYEHLGFKPLAGHTPLRFTGN